MVWSLACAKTDGMKAAYCLSSLFVGLKSSCRSSWGDVGVKRHNYFEREIYRRHNRTSILTFPASTWLSGIPSLRQQRPRQAAPPPPWAPGY